MPKYKFIVINRIGAEFESSPRGTPQSFAAVRPRRSFPPTT